MKMRNKYLIIGLALVVAADMVILSSTNLIENSKEIVEEKINFNRCGVTHRWKLPNITFPDDLADSNVKIIAFLRASCGFCRAQSKK